MLGVLKVDLAVQLLKASVKKMYKRKGPAIINKNMDAIDKSLDPNALVNILYPADAWLTLTDVKFCAKNYVISNRNLLNMKATLALPQKN